MNRAIREQARQLRKKGMAVNKIALELKVGKSSVSRWVRDIVLTPEQLAVPDNQRGRLSAQNKGARKNLELARKRRELAQLQGRQKARENNLLHRQGCLLYWAEGAKTRNAVVFVNSDIEMMLLFVRFLRESMAIPDEMISIFIHCHTHDQEKQSEIGRYWLDKLKLPDTCLRQTLVKQGSNTRKNILVNGICALRVSDTRIAQHIYGAIQEYAGFERPEWLF